MIAPQDSSVYVLLQFDATYYNAVNLTPNVTLLCQPERLINSIYAAEFGCVYFPLHPCMILIPKVLHTVQYSSNISSGHVL